MSDKIAKAIELEFEEILADAEDVVKTYVPARKVKAVLTKIEAALEAEGIEALFDKKVTREALRKTAAEEVTDKELKEFVEQITKAIIDEAEEVLKDADEVADETVETTEKAAKFEMEAKVKSMLEKKMASKGIYCKFARNQKKAGNSILAKIKATK